MFLKRLVFSIASTLRIFAKTGLTRDSRNHNARSNLVEYIHNNIRQGELSFERLLRVDGSFKGHLISTGDLVIGASGVVRGNIEHLREVM